MTNLFASGLQALNIIRRDLEDLFDEVLLPRRMRFEVARVFEQSSSPIWVWRAMDQILDAFMTPPTIRRRVDRIFDRVLSDRAFGMYNQNAGAPFFTSQQFGSPAFYGSQFGGNELASPFQMQQFRGNDQNTFGSFQNTFGSPFQNTFGSFQNTFGSPFQMQQLRGNDPWSTFNMPFHAQQFRGGFTNDFFFTPPLELVETQNEYVVRVDVPGVRETDVETTITGDNVLVIRGERRDFVNARNAGFTQGSSMFARGNAATEYSEQNYGVFTRTVQLPRNINPTQVMAIVRDGVLEVSIAKTDSLNTFNNLSTFNNTFGTFNNGFNNTFGTFNNGFNNTFGQFNNGFGQFNTAFNARNRRVPILRDESRGSFGFPFANTNRWTGEHRLHAN